MMKHSDIPVEARKWMGTRFHHQGRLRGVGCDCIGMVLGVLDDMGIKSRQRGDDGERLPFVLFDDRTYAPDPNSERLKETLETHLKDIDAASIRPGDILLFRIIHLPQHVGIVGDHPNGGLSLIHAYAPAGKVVEEGLTESWRTRIIGAYRAVLMKAGA
jgi:NlpC/P60 family putative phage cell wall peptidase